MSENQRPAGKRVAVLLSYRRSRWPIFDGGVAIWLEVTLDANMHIRKYVNALAHIFDECAGFVWQGEPISGLDMEKKSVPFFYEEGMLTTKDTYFSCDAHRNST